MKKLIVSLFVLAASLMSLANPIDQEKARQIANEFMTNHESVRTTSLRRISSPSNTPQLVFKEIILPLAPSNIEGETNMKNLYAFADDVNGGFVIVAGDDRVEPVLAYSETDTFNPYTMPQAMQVMLLSYERQIGSLPANAPVRSSAPSANRAVIPPLVQTMWHQYLPFSYNCPYNESVGRNTLVGCVALTLAQLMYYYQYPKSTKLTIPAYTTGEGYEMKALPPTTFNYSKMHLNYDYVYDRSEVDPDDPSVVEVTKLLLYAGCAVQMQYSTMGSAATFDPAIIAKYFGFDKGCRALLAGNYPHEVWEEMVYNELAAGRPVPYSAGAYGYQSHQFIIDGYDGQGFFHANIGEIGRGSDNVFYRLGVLNNCREQFVPMNYSGYNFNQAGFFGFQPDKGNDPVPVVSVDYGDYSLSKTDFTRSSTSADFKDIVLKAEMKRLDTNGHTMDCGWGLFQNGLMKKVLCSSTTSQETINLNTKFAMGSQLQNGTYQIFPIFRNHGAEEWESYLEYRYYTENGKRMRHYTATINNNNLHIGVSSIEANIKVNKVEYYAAYEGEKLDTRVWLTNNGTNYENDLFFWIDGNLLTAVGAYVTPGKSDYIDFCAVAPTKGTHNVKITSDFEGEKVVYTGTVTITASPQCNLELVSSSVKGLDDNRDIHGTLEVVLKVKNVGETPFANMFFGYGEGYLDDGHGSITGDDDKGYPRWVWESVWYEKLQPGEETELAFTLGKEAFKPNDYKYGFSVDYYNNKSNSVRLWSLAYIHYFDDYNISTSVSDVFQDSDDAVYYDLQGRRIATDALKRGVYIHNNKKILVK